MCIRVPKNKRIYSKRNENLELLKYMDYTTVSKYCTDKRQSTIGLRNDKQSK